MIAAFAVLVLLALTSGLRGERALLFLKRMAPKWLATGVVLALLALGLLNAEFSARNLAVLAMAILIIALEGALVCAILALLFYVWGRIAHRAPQEKVA